MKEILKRLIPARLRPAIRNNFQFLYHKTFYKKTFQFNGEDYLYFFRKYNSTFLNERAVEIPIIVDFIEKYKGKRILEIGNVLKHYFDFDFEVVDKYEKHPGVVNVDIVDFDCSEKYDLIVSISTFEHIGYDENARYGNLEDNNIQPNSVLKAIEKTKTLLKPGGVFIFTIPLGFNSFLDSRIERNEINMTKLLFLKRINAENDWIQTDYAGVKASTYGHPYICANAIMIGIYRN